MPKVSKKFTTLLILMIAIGVVHATRFVLHSLRKNVSQGLLTKALGPEEAPIKIEEYIDFQCPACAGGAKYLKEAIRNYPKAIRLELRHFPLAMHKHGFLSSQYAECAALQGKFWPFVDLLLTRQGNWQRLEDARPAFEQIGVDLALDVDQLKACVADGKINKNIDDDRAEGQILGIRSTPTYFVNGKMVVGSTNLMTEITELLKQNGY